MVNLYKIIFVLLLVSCTAEMSNKKTLIVSSKECDINDCVYNIKSWKGGSWLGEFDIRSDQNQFNVGDTVKIVRK